MYMTVAFSIALKTGGEEIKKKNKNQPGHSAHTFHRWAGNKRIQNHLRNCVRSRLSLPDRNLVETEGNSRVRTKKYLTGAGEMFSDKEHWLLLQRPRLIPSTHMR